MMQPLLVKLGRLTEEQIMRILRQAAVCNGGQGNRGWSKNVLLYGSAFSAIVNVSARALPETWLVAMSASATSISTTRCDKDRLDPEPRIGAQFHSNLFL
jgi:hypothetical protein